MKTVLNLIIYKAHFLQDVQKIMYALMEQLLIAFALVA